MNEALQLSSKGGHTDLVKFLIEKGADVTADNNRAIVLAAKEENTELVELLLAYGAHVTDIESKVLLSTPVKNGNIELVKLLVVHGVLPTEETCYSLFLNAINGGYVEILKIIIRYADEKMINDLLEIAIGNKNLKIIEILLENGADIELFKKKDMQLALLYDPNIILKDIIKHLSTFN